jgi:hypothetical protein
MFDLFDLLGDEMPMSMELTETQRLIRSPSASVPAVFIALEGP